MEEVYGPPVDDITDIMEDHSWQDIEPDKVAPTGINDDGQGEAFTENIDPELPDYMADVNM